jgi:hypothetical protein
MLTMTYDFEVNGKLHSLFLKNRHYLDWQSRGFSPCYFIAWFKDLSVILGLDLTEFSLKYALALYCRHWSTGCMIPPCFKFPFFFYCRLAEKNGTMARCNSLVSIYGNQHGLTMGSCGSLPESRHGRLTQGLRRDSFPWGIFVLPYS